MLAAGAVEVPTWREAAKDTKRPPKVEAVDPSDFERGWQCYANSFLEKTFLECVVRPQCDKTRLALLLSQSGGAAGAWLRALPSEKAFSLSPLRFQVAVRRRLRWPLPLSTGVCCRSCQKELDCYGDRAAACPTAGRLATRARPVEKTWARFLREAGARVRENVHLSDTTLLEPEADDGRRVEVVASGLPLAQGVPLAVDATLVSPVRADGTPSPRAHYLPGSTFARAEKLKQTTYPELVQSSVLRLKTVACEVCGRWNSVALNLLDELATARARTEVKVLQSAASRAWRSRWTEMLAVSVQEALASTLANEGKGLLESDGKQPVSVDVCLARECQGREEGEKEEQPVSARVRFVTRERHRQTSPLTLAALV